MTVLNKFEIEDKIVLDALTEDIGLGDITTDCIISEDHCSEFNLVINQDATLSGLDVFKRVFELVDSNIKVAGQYKNGDALQKGTYICSLSGKTRNILKAERTAINFLAHLSGIATMAKELKDLIISFNVELLDTRKTTPNLRMFEKKAICDGGAKMHRFNLNDRVLIKDNHKNSAGGIRNAMNLVRKNLRDKKILIEVEVENIDELKEAISCRPNIIMFDNWTVQELQKAIKFIPEGVYTEASGMINKSNIKEYAKTGVKSISTSCMIKERKWIDFSLEVHKNN